MAELVKSKQDMHELQANRIWSHNVTAAAAWCGGVAVEEHDALQHNIVYPAINVPTANGPKRAQEGDWIIRRPIGDFIVLKHPEFMEQYETIS